MSQLIVSPGCSAVIMLSRKVKTASSKAKAANQSTEDYIARSFLGSQYGGLAHTMGAKPATGNKNADKWLNRTKLERLMSTGDSQVSAYFLSSLGDTVRMIWFRSFLSKFWYWNNPLIIPRYSVSAVSSLTFGNTVPTI